MERTIKSVRDFFKKLPTEPSKSLPGELVFHSIFTANGKQGMVGLLDYNGRKVVYKISQYLNYLASHENTVMECLDKIQDFCPHFCRSLGTFNAYIDPNFRKIKNPFDIISKYPVIGEVLVMEYLENTRKFYHYLKKKNMDDEVLHSIIQQTMCAILASQKYTRFTHYDLHSNNIMIKKCDHNQVSVYRVSEDKVFIIPTYGFQPVIIDYGFSYCQDLDNQPAWATLGHTEMGFMSQTFDKWTDFKLFLVTIGCEMEGYHSKTSGKRFNRLIKNIFRPLHIDWDSGWDKSDEMSASDYAITLIENDIESEFFSECMQFCIDFVQTLATLPLQSRNYEDIVLSYKTVEKEFMKIEDEITNKFYLLYVFKCIVDSARSVQTLYINPEKRDDAVRKFRHDVYDALNKVSKFAKPRLNYEKLLCSLILWGRQSSGVMFDVCRERMNEKKKEYRKLEVKEPVDILEKIHEEFGFEWDADESTYFQIYDFVDKKTYRLDLDEEEREIFNEANNEDRAKMIISK